MTHKLQSKEISTINASISRKEKVMVRNLQLAERAFLVSSFKSKTLYVATSVADAKRVEAQCRSVYKRAKVLSSVLEVFSYKASVNEVLDDYLQALALLALDKLDVLVITPEILLSRLVNKSVYIENIIELKVGNCHNLQELKTKLAHLGYRRVDSVERVGEFSIRGDICDIFALGYGQPIRIEFWGDDIENINFYEVETYQNVGNLETASICPNTLNLGIFSVENISFLDTEMDIKDKLLSGVRDNSLIYTLPCFSSFDSSFCKWFCDDVVVLDEPKRVYDLLTQASVQYESDLKRQVEENLLAKQHLNFYIKAKDTLIKDTQAVICFSNLDVRNPLCFATDVVYMQAVIMSRYAGRDDLLASDMSYFKSLGITQVLSYETTEQCEMLKAILDTKKISYKVWQSENENSKDFLPFDFENGSINICPCKIEYSIGFLNESFVVFSISSLFGELKKVESSKAKSRVFYLPKIGEYVVHEMHGVGRCKDVCKMNLGFCEKDYIVIEYAKGDILYLPTEHTDEISKYYGGDHEPKLDSLGSESFRRAKDRARESAKELAFDLKKLYAKRSAKRGFVYEAENFLVNQFIQSAGYELTKDQQDAVQDICREMESGKLMDRLVCGDVGFGKTEVALITAYKTALSGRQVAFLAPTTILCYQHYTNAVNRFKDFGLRVGMLSRFNSQKKNKEIIEALVSGEIDVVCGTHRMLSDDVKFKNLGLLILDEEQRFGVGDKEKIKNIKEDVNVLTLSATPIPRTLHMSLIGVRDVSLITTPPAQRMPITTVVCEYSNSVLVEACRRELSRDGQVLIIFNRVEGIYKFANEVRALLPDAIIDVAHGQMDNKTLEGIILKLYSKETQVLVSTTLIENGVDLPMANTLVVVNADYLGLSQLYQLRGRVGRSTRTSFAYFTYDRGKIISDTSMKRLEALREFSELGSGFKIAMRDLEIRGAGELLGAKQSGHIEKVGYNMYCRLIEDALKEDENANAFVMRDVKVEIALPAYAPEDLIKSSLERMKLYSEIAHISSEAELEVVKNRIVEGFGRLPKELEQLLYVGLLKNLAKQCGVEKIVLNDYASYFSFYADLDERVQLASVLSGDFADVVSVDKENQCRFNIKKSIQLQDRQKSIMNFLIKLSKVVA